MQEFMVVGQIRDGREKLTSLLIISGSHVQCRNGARQTWL